MDDARHCITCADDGAPMTVERVDPDTGLARCAGGAGETADVETALVSPVGPGDRVLVHAGVAIATLEAEGAG